MPPPVVVANISGINQLLAVNNINFTIKMINSEVIKIYLPESIDYKTLIEVFVLSRH